jgi:general secretion pathway protein F/type IV pilus assembly protein PilC
VIFAYKGIDQNGNSIKARIEANSKEEALEKLRGLSIFVEKIKEVNEKDMLFAIKAFLHHRYNKVPVNYLSSLSKELSIYLKSGMNLTQALMILKEQQESTKALQFVNQLYSILIEGTSFSNALTKQTVYYIPEFYVKTIEASENSGNLDSVLEQLSELLKQNQKLESEVQNALIYPSFIFTMSIFVVVFLINYVIPKISKIFVQMNQELPTSTKIVIAMGDFMQNYGTLVFGIFFTVLVIFLSVLNTNEAFRKKFDLFMLKVPLIGKLIFISEIARFSVITANLLSAGMPFVQAILLATKTFKNKAISSEFGAMSKLIVEGRSLTKSIQAIKDIPMPKSFVHAISIGESSGNLPEMMKNIAELYTFDLKSKKDMFIALLEPMVILFMGLIVGFIIVSMLLPIFSINFQ